MTCTSTPSRAAPTATCPREDLILEAERLGLRGLCITEHSGPWDRHEFERFASRHNVVLVRAMEADTNMGHMLAFGMDSYQPGFHKAELLCKAARADGGFVVSAHPFRGVLGKHMRERPYLYRTMPDEPLPTYAEEALEHPVFKLANAIEVVNGGTADEENGLAMEVASLLRMPVTGGSDAHSVHGLGRYVTVFPDEIQTEAEFLTALKSGKFFPAVGLRAGQLRPYTG